MFEKVRSKLSSFVNDYKKQISVVLSAALLVAAFAGLGAAMERKGESAGVFASQRQVPVYRVNTNGEKKIAISFDAAWGSEKTLGILDILDQYQIKSTFFLVGFWCDRYPERVQLIAQRGHEIGNHSTNHPNMPTLSSEQMASELKTTGDKIAQLTGTAPTLFRFPYGDYDNASMQAVKDHGYTPVQWDVDSLDWKEQGTDAMVSQVMGKVQPGSIVLFHNNSRDILEALPIILNQLIKEGYSIVPVSELLLDQPYYVDHQGVQQPQVG